MKPVPDNLEDMERVGDLRSSEISKMFSPHFSAFDNYRRMLIALNIILGQHKPKDDCDKTIRNFMADTYDLLEELIPILRRGRHNVASLLVRRIYENVSLVNAFLLNTDIHNKWMKGDEIPNWEVRKELDKSALGAEIESTKYIYYALSDRAHPSRIAISDRFLGEDNKFTLGGYITPSLALTAELLVRSLSLFFWFGALLGFFYKRVWSNSKPEFKDLYEQVSTNALNINSKLFDELDRLYKEENFVEVEQVTRKSNRREKERN